MKDDNPIEAAARQLRDTRWEIFDRWLNDYLTMHNATPAQEDLLFTEDDMYAAWEAGRHDGH